jgi:dihydroflavonol-4-reductase
MSMPHDRVLVTGGSGLAGAHIVRDLLPAGYRVRCLVRRPEAPALRRLDVELVHGDVRDQGAVRRAVEGCRFVIHAAATYRLAARHAREAFETNVGGTRLVMQAALAAGAERIVHTSSVATIGPAAGRLATEEDHATLDLLPGPYERSKWAAEVLVSRMIREHGLPAVIVNPCTVIGAWDTRPTRTGRLILDTARGRMPAYVNTGMNVVAATDVATGHRLALEKGTTGRRYILGGENLTLRDLLERIDRLAIGRVRRRIRMPHAAALAAGYVSEWLWSPTTRKEPAVPLAGARLARHFMYYDASRARRELGVPVTPVEDAIEAALNWFSVNNYL